jgi:acyl-CoA thioesterase FadM
VEKLQNDIDGIGNDAKYYVACQEAIWRVVWKNDFPETKVADSISKPPIALWTCNFLRE